MDRAIPYRNRWDAHGVVRSMVPAWLHLLSICALLVGFASAVAVAIDEFRRPQHMWIMNVVWPITALYAGPLGVWGYFRYGRLATKEKFKVAQKLDKQAQSKTQTPFAAMVGKGAAHCGSGCALGDILAEWLVYAVPALAVWFGYRSIFPEKMFAVWVVDYIFAFTLGIVFQYFTIVPMRDLSFGDGVKAALKADTLSLTAWQIGMYGFMAIAQFYLFRTLLGMKLEVDSAEFWFMMQIAMAAGFLTSYPVNWWLLTVGLKEKM